MLNALFFWSILNKKEFSTLLIRRELDLEYKVLSSRFEFEYDAGVLRTLAITPLVAFLGFLTGFTAKNINPLQAKAKS